MASPGGGGAAFAGSGDTAGSGRTGGSSSGSGGRAGDSRAGSSGPGGSSSAPSGRAGDSGAGSGNGSGSAGETSGRSGGSAGETSGGFAVQIPLSRTFTDVDGAVAPTDLPFVGSFCGDAAVPSSLKPIGTVVRARVSLRYFVCIGDLGMTSYDLIQTNQPGDQTQGFTPYAALFRYEDPANPNLERPSKGATNYGLISVNLLRTLATSQCDGSNDTFRSFKVGGALAEACAGVPSPVRDEGGNKYVDVTFPGGQRQSFLLEPVPFEPPPG